MMYSPWAPSLLKIMKAEGQAGKDGKGLYVAVGLTAFFMPGTAATATRRQSRMKICVTSPSPPAASIPRGRLLRSRRTTGLAHASLELSLHTGVGA